jgi:iron complex transport system ATP-binding protein
MALEPPLIMLRGAGFRYGDRPVFSAIDLDVHSGEVLTVLGPNGCGKSTLLHCIGGSLALTAGSVHLAGQDLMQLGPTDRARQVGFLFQDHVPSFPFSVLDVAVMGRTPYLGIFGAPSRQDMVLAEAALEQLGIGHLSDRPYTELSGGERQLALLARTLVQQPKVILLDEPTAHLDMKNQVRCLQIIRALAAQGIAMIMSSHDPNHAFAFSGRVALMQPGKTPLVGTADSVLTEVALSASYGTDIAVFEVAGGQNTFKFCSPWQTR